MAPQLTEDEIDDLNYTARVGETAELKNLLESLAQREKVSPAQILLIAKDDSKATCLHKASGNGHLETVQAILGNFADSSKEEKQEFVDTANEFGNTGLHWAALGGHLSVVKCLVEEHGANVGLANDRNYVPLDLASFGEEPKRDVVDYFLSTMNKLEADAKGQDGGSGLAEAAKRLDVDGKTDDEDGEEVRMVATEGENIKM